MHSNTYRSTVSRLRTDFTSNGVLNSPVGKQFTPPVPNGYCYLVYKPCARMVHKLGIYPKLSAVTAVLTKYYKPTDLIPAFTITSEIMAHVDQDTTDYLSVKMFRRVAKRLGEHFSIGSINEERLLRNIDSLLGDEADNNQREILQSLIKKDTKIRNSYESALISSLTQKCTPTNGKQVINIKPVLEPAVKTKFENAFPEFELNFLDSESAGHPAAAASRVLESVLCLKFHNYDKTNFEKAASVWGIGQGKRFDDLINDIGGNYTYHAMAGNVGIHSCCPRLNSYDATRETLRAVQLNNAIVNKTLPSITANNGLNYCNNLCQRCKRTAPLAMAIQAAYDIPLTTLCAALYNKGTKVLYATIIFDPKILEEDVGYLPDLNMHYNINRKTRVIQFYFENDTSFGYTHDLDNYLEYITRSNVQLGNNKEYTIEKLGIRMNVLYLRVTAIGSNYVYNDNLFFALTNNNNKDMTTIEYYDWDYSAAPNSNVLRFKKIITKMPKKLYKDVAGYALTIKEGRFNPSVILDYMRGISSTVVHSGKSIARFEHKDPKDLMVWSNAIYFHVYKMRWELGKLTQGLIDREKRVRALADKGIVTACMLYCYYSVRNMVAGVSYFGRKARSAAINAYGRPRDTVKETEYIKLLTDSSQLKVDHSNYSNSQIQWYFDISHHEVPIRDIINGEIGNENFLEIPVDDEKSFHPLSEPEEKNSPYSSNDNSDNNSMTSETSTKAGKYVGSTGTAYSTATKLFTSQLTKAANREDYNESERKIMGDAVKVWKTPVTEYSRNLATETGVTPELMKIKGKKAFKKQNKSRINGGFEHFSICDRESHEVTRNIGAGNCFFYSVLGSDDMVAALEMRRALLAINWASIYNVTEAKEITAMLENVTAPVDDRIFEKFAEIYGYHIRIHDMQDQCVVYTYGINNTNIVEILHTPMHFERLVVKHIIDKPLEEKLIADVVHVYKQFMENILAQRHYNVIDPKSLLHILLKRVKTTNLIKLTDHNDLLMEYQKIKDCIKPDDVIMCATESLTLLCQTLIDKHLTIYPYGGYKFVKIGKVCKIDNEVINVYELKDSTDLSEIEDFRLTRHTRFNERITLVSRVAIPDNWYVCDFDRLKVFPLNNVVVYDPEKILRPGRIHRLNSELCLKFVNQVQPNDDVIFVLPYNRNSNQIKLIANHKGKVIFLERKILKHYNSLINDAKNFEKPTFNSDICEKFFEYNYEMSLISKTQYKVLIDNHQASFPETAFSNDERKILEILTNGYITNRVNTVLSICTSSGGAVPAIAKTYPGRRIDYHKYKLGDRSVSIIDKLATDITVDSGDLLDLESVANLTNVNKKYDLITADCSGKATPNHDQCVNRVANQIYTILKLLKYGGSVIVQMYYMKCYEELLAVLHPYFRTLKVMKPRNSNIFSSEVFIIATGYGSICQSYEDTAFESLINIMETVTPESNDEGSVVSDLESVDIEVCNTEVLDTDPEPELVVVNKPKDTRSLTKQDLVPVSSLSLNDYQPVDKHVETVFISPKNKYNCNVERNENKDPEIFKRNSLREISAIWECTNPILLEMYHRLYAEFGLIDASAANLKLTTTSKIDCETKPYVLVNAFNGKILYPKKFVGVHSHGFMAGGFLALNALKDKNGKFVGYEPIRNSRYKDCIILCGPETELMLEQRLLQKYHKHVSEPIYLGNTSFYHIQGVTGGGKSTLIGTIAKSTDLVLTSTVANKESLQEKCPQVKVSTVHSYILNNKNKYEVIIIDEASMRHFGEIMLIAEKASPRVIVLVGDISQLKYFTRIPTALIRYSHHGDILPVNVTFNISHRIPCDVAACFQDVYPEKLLTTNKIVKSMKVVRFTGLQDIPKGYHVLVFTRAEKCQLSELGFKVNTIGEIQGCTYKSVCLVRLNKIPGEKIFSDKDQLLVGLTRHTDDLVYLTVLDDDAVSQRIKTVTSLSSKELKQYLAKDASKVIKAKTEEVLKQIANHRTDKGRLVGGGGEYVKHIARPALHSTGFENVDEFVYNCGTPFVSPSYKPVLVEAPVSPVKTPLTEDSDPMLLQSYFDRIFPHHKAVDTKAATLFVDQNPVEILNKNVTTVVGRGLSKQKDYDCLRPAVLTNVPAPRQETQKEILLALDKRNLNIPDIDLDVDQDFVIETMLERFEERFVKNKDLYKQFENEPITLSNDTVLEWLGKQDNSIPGRIKEEKLDTNNLHKYQLTMKANVKPQLDLDADKEYNAPQTVVFKEKEFNLYFAPIFKEVKDRLMSVKTETIQIFTDCSPDEFAYKLTLNWPIPYVSSLETLEIDFKKFDKCQHSLLFKFECELYRRLGVSEHHLELWKASHEHTTLKSFAAGVKTRVNYQRKSGDPVTLLGNTIVSMAMIILLYDFEYATFVGDDVSLFGVDIVDRNQYFTSIFGMESKVFSYKCSYFCSKFLLFFGDKVYFVPDPVKLLVKLGRHDLRNEEHVEEYRISTMDLIKNYSNAVVVRFLALAVAERYNLNYSIEPLITTLYSTISSPSKFQELYYSYSTDVKYVGLLPEV